MRQNGSAYPRDLADYERALLFWILPQERAGYRQYRRYVQTWKVIAQGRRGEGNYILGAVGAQPDNVSPLPQVFAYGVVQTSTGELSVSVRERLEDQVEYEIASLQGSVDPSRFDEVQRWTYSTWLPTEACPICNTPLREVPMSTADGESFSLALCGMDQRMWVYDARSGVNHPIPVTNFYNELMLQKNIRDPNIALHPVSLFDRLHHYDDRDFVRAFQSYNRIRTKVSVEGEFIIEEQHQSWWHRLTGLVTLTRKQST